MADLTKKPDWLRKKIFESSRKRQVLELLERRNLNTVCQGAKCPNLCECFDRGTATFMILGDTCTRNCTFCAVSKGMPNLVNTKEPLEVAEAIAELKLKHAVITSVTRDDLADGGAEQFAEVVREIRRLSKETVIEILTPDFKGDFSVLQTFKDRLPDIFNHNLETVPRLYKIRPKAQYLRSLELIREFKKLFPTVTTKSGLMVGLGEEVSEIKEVLNTLRDYNCEVVSIGQYLSPSKNHVPVVEYITPQQFAEYEEYARQIGFKAVFSGPFVRSSYMADTIKVV